MIDYLEYAKQVDEGERLSKELHLTRIERDELSAKLNTAVEALQDIQKNYDCECVQGDRIRGHHHCQSCVAKEALEEIGKIMKRNSPESKV